MSAPSRDPARATFSAVLSGGRLRFVMWLLVATFIGELAGGIISRSLGLVSDSFHVLADIFALGLAYAAVAIANRRLPTETMTYGYGRLEVLTSLLNGVTLVAASTVILYQAAHRLLDPPEIRVSVALPVAVLGLAVNAVAVAVLRTGGLHRHDLNVRAAYLHVLADFGASLAVIAGLVVHLGTGIRWGDPLVAAGISIVLVLGAIRVLRQAAGILLQQSPQDIEELRSLVRTVDKVVDIDDLRLWQICSHMVIGTAHVITDVERLDETEEIAARIRTLLEERYQVKHLTLQFETRQMWEKHTHDVRHDEERARSPVREGN